jgi:hypothetical protein
MAGVVHPIHGEAHHHGPPTGFIRKYIFSVDHKVIGIQYWFLALFSVFIGMFLSLLMRLQLGWPGQQFGFLKFLFPTAAETGTITPEPLACDHARDDDGLLRVDHGAAGRIRQLLFAYPDRRG